MSTQYKPFFNYAANLFGSDPGTLWNMAKLESSFNPSAQNNWDSNARAGTPSYGMMQFIQPTFNSFYKQARQTRPGVFSQLGPENWRDWRQQVAVASWALANGKGSHWATYDRARQNGGPIGGSSGFSITPGYTGKQTYQYQVVKPGKPLDTGHIARINRLFAEQPWKIDRLTKPIYKAAEPVLVNKTGAFNYAMPSGYGAAGNPFIKGSNPFQFLENRLGLVATSGDHERPGAHVQGSYHYRPASFGGVQAYDFGSSRNNDAKLRNLASWLQKHPGWLRKVSEFYYDPLGWYIKNGRVVQGSIGGHGDHAHLAFGNWY